MLQCDRRRLELAYSLMRTLPGTPVIRYGDEIGMDDTCGVLNAIALELLCNGPLEVHGGFNTNPKPVSPVISDGPYGYQHVNVAEQRRNPDSLLNWRERIIRMRKEVAEIGLGDFAVLKTGIAQLSWRSVTAGGRTGL